MTSSTASNRTQKTAPLPPADLVSHPPRRARGRRFLTPRWARASAPRRQSSLSRGAARRPPSVPAARPSRPRTRRRLPGRQPVGWPCQDPVRRRRPGDTHVPPAGNTEGAVLQRSDAVRRNQTLGVWPDRCSGRTGSDGSGSRRTWGTWRGIRLRPQPGRPTRWSPSPPLWGLSADVAVGLGAVSVKSAVRGWLPCDPLERGMARRGR